MRIVVRLAAVWLAGIAFLTLSGLIVLVSRRGFTHLALFSGLMVFDLVLTIVGGPIAAIQLWRFKRSGRTVGLIVFGVRLFYSTVGLAMFPVPGARLPYVAVSATFDLLGGTILSLASFRRTLQPSA